MKEAIVILANGPAQQPSTTAPHLRAEAEETGGAGGGEAERFHLMISVYKTNALHNTAKYATLSGKRIVTEEVMRTFPLSAEKPIRRMKRK